MGTEVQQPAPQNYGQNMADTLRAQMEMETGTGRFADLGPRINLERSLAPQYQDLQLGLVKSAAPQVLDLYNQARANDITAIQTLGPQARAALAAANPAQAKLVDTMTQQAQAQLDAGSQLTPEQQRQVQQDSRAAFAARGIVDSPRSAVDEIVRGQLASQGILQQRQGMAMGALQAGQAFYGDPFSQILNRQGSTAVAQAQGFNPGKILNPESAYAGNLYNQNYQGQLAAGTASAANSAALAGAGIGAAGNAL